MLGVRMLNDMIDIWQNYNNMREVSLDGQHVL